VPPMTANAVPILELTDLYSYSTSPLTTVISIVLGD